MLQIIIKIQKKLKVSVKKQNACHSIFSKDILKTNKKLIKIDTISTKSSKKVAFLKTYDNCLF